MFVQKIHTQNVDEIDGRSAKYSNTIQNIFQNITEKGETEEEMVLVM